jgi:DNA-binding transcriptional LysR family regulator
MERRIERRVEVVVPTFSALAATIVGTNRIALLHQRLAEVFAARLPIRILELPMELPPVREFVQWHKLRDRDIGLLWLIDKLQANAAQLALGGTGEIHV